MMAAKFCAAHPGGCVGLSIFAVALAMFLFVLAFNLCRNTINGSSERVHSGSLTSANPSNSESLESLVSPSLQNSGLSGKANTALQGQSILTATATRNDVLLATPSSGSLA